MDSFGLLSEKSRILPEIAYINGGGGGGGGGANSKKVKKKSKSISGILGWVLTFFDPKF